MNNVKLAEELVKLAESVVEGRELGKDVIYDDGEYYVKDLRNTGNGIRVMSRSSSYIY